MKSDKPASSPDAGDQRPLELLLRQGLATDSADAGAAAARKRGPVMASSSQTTATGYLQRRPRPDPATARLLVWNPGAPSGRTGGAPAYREDAAPIERPHQRRYRRRSGTRSASPAFILRRAPRRGRRASR